MLLILITIGQSVLCGLLAGVIMFAVCIAAFKRSRCVSPILDTELDSRIDTILSFAASVFVFCLATFVILVCNFG